MVVYLVGEILLSHDKEGIQYFNIQQCGRLSKAMLNDVLGTNECILSDAIVTMCDKGIHGPDWIWRR